MKHAHRYGNALCAITLCAVAGAGCASQLADYIDDANAIVGAAGKAAVARWMEHAQEYDLRRLVPKLAGKSLLLIGAQGDTIVPLD